MMIGWYGDDNDMTATCWCQCLMRKRPHSLIRADSTLSSTIQSELNLPTKMIMMILMIMMIMMMKTMSDENKTASITYKCGQLYTNSISFYKQSSTSGRASSEMRLR